MIVVFLNPRSRANRRDPGLSRRLARTLGDAGRVLASPTFEALAEDARSLAAAPPRVIAVHGGDGTLHHVLTALLDAFAGGPPLPPIAILGGGTMNVVSASLGIRARTFPFLADLARQARAGTPFPTVARRCMKVGNQFGFVFGNGILANFLGEYYARPGYGPARAFWLLAKIFVSAVASGPLAERVFRPRRDRVTVDGQVLPFAALTAVSAGTVREVGLRFKLNHRADDDPDRFAVLAIHGTARTLIPDILSVYMGRGISVARAYSTLATELEIVPADGECPYTIDGDLYRLHEPLRVAIGPRVEFVDPRGGASLKRQRH
jgi:diacylglycerol kinase family enzyme